MVENQHWSPNCGQKEIVPGGQKENEARKASQKASRKAMKAFGKVDFALAHWKEEGQGSKRKRQGRFPSTVRGFQPLNSPSKRDKTIPGNQKIGNPAFLKILQLLPSTIQDTLHASHLAHVLGCTRPRDRQSEVSRNTR